MRSGFGWGDVGFYFLGVSDIGVSDITSIDPAHHLGFVPCVPLPIPVKTSLLFYFRTARGTIVNQ